MTTRPPRGDYTFHVDGLKGLKHRLRDDFPYRSVKPVGSWQMDSHAQLIPWREEIKTEDQITFVRLAVGRAWEAGRAALARQRSRREARLVAAKGILEPAKWKPATRHPVRRVKGGARKLRAVIESLEEQDVVGALRKASQLGQHLGVDSAPAERVVLWLECGQKTLDEFMLWCLTIEKAAAGRPGDKGQYELDAFIRSLASWWSRNTGKRPQKTRPTERKKAPRSANFVDFVEAGWHDATDPPRENVERAVKRVLRAMEARQLDSK
jgi:hypothetical protein